MSKALVVAGVLTVSLGAFLLLGASKRAQGEAEAYGEAPSTSVACRIGYVLLGLGFLAQGVGTTLP